MLIPLPEIIKKYNLKIKGVIQVGAHWAEEHEIFVTLGIRNIVYIEPCKDAFGILCNKFDVGNGEKDHYGFLDAKQPNGTVIGARSDGIIIYWTACGEEEGEFDMYVSNSNQGQSNSLLKPSLHLQQHPEVVFTEHERVKVVPLDNLPIKKENYNLLVMDVQGAEGLVLKGATETLKHIDCIYTEVNRGQTYDGNMEIEEMDEYLKPFGFIRVETYWPSQSWSWGDAVFIRKKYYSMNDYVRDNPREFEDD